MPENHGRMQGAPWSRLWSQGQAVVPKAELHCHIEGAVTPALALIKAEAVGADLSDIIIGGHYFWRDFTEFLAVYDRVAALFASEEDYSDLAYDHLTGLSRQRCLYAEFFISTDHARTVGVGERAYVDGLADGIARANAETGITARMIATGLRHGGPEAVTRAAQWIADNPHPLVTGFGMAGEERMHHPRDFVHAFAIARDAGLAITVHAGELAGADSVRAALDHLKPARIGHGVRAIEDMSLVARLADEGIVLECCPASNIALDVFPDYQHHPFLALRAAGCKVTLNSDDPPHFQSSLAEEYRIGTDEFGLSDEALVAITRTALEAAFVDEATKATILAQLDAMAAAIAC